MARRHGHRAFTLVELVVVVVVIAVLAAVASIAVAAHLASSRDKAALASTVAVRTAIGTGAAGTDQTPSQYVAANLASLATLNGLHLPPGTTLTANSAAAPTAVQLDLGGTGAHLQCLALPDQGPGAISAGACGGSDLVYNGAAAVDLTGIRNTPVYDPTNITLTRVTPAGAPVGSGTAVEISILRAGPAGWGYLPSWHLQSAPAGSHGTVELWARGTAGAYTNLNLNVCNDPATSCPVPSIGSVTLTGTWQKFVLPYAATGSIVDGTHYLRLAIANPTNPLTVQVTGVRVLPS